MKHLFRRMAGLSLGLPIVAMVWGLSLVMGKERSVELVGPKITHLSKLALRFWIPEIRDATDFDSFRVKMRANLDVWRLFYDVTVEKDDPDTFRIRVQNCPFCEMLINAGYPEIGPHVCQGDWEVAKENAHKWRFEREHQIGTGDSFCDHTYKRL